MPACRRCISGCRDSEHLELPQGLAPPCHQRVKECVKKVQRGQKT